MQLDNLDYEQREWVIQKFIEWMRIRSEESYYGYANPPRTSDVDHSSLLRVLLEGIEPHKYPPPKSYSYPNYYAMDHETFPQEIWFKKGDIWSEDILMKEVETTDVVPGSVRIDQLPWNVLRREGQNFIIKHEGRDPAEWVLRPRTEEEIEEAIVNHKAPYDKTRITPEKQEQLLRENYKKRHRWALKRIPPKE